VVWDTPHLPRLKWPSRRPLSLPQARITRAMLGGGLAYETPNICLPVEYRSSLTDTPQICGRWSPSNHADGFPVTSAPICPGDSAAAQHVHQRCARRGPPVPVRRGCPPRLGRRSPGRCSGFKSPPPSVPMCPRGCCQGRQEDLNFPNLPPPGSPREWRPPPTPDRPGPVTQSPPPPSTNGSPRRAWPSPSARCLDPPFTGAGIPPPPSPNLFHPRGRNHFSHLETTAARASGLGRGPPTNHPHSPDSCCQCRPSLFPPAGAPDGGHVLGLVRRPRSHPLVCLLQHPGPPRWRRPPPSPWRPQ